MTLLRDAAFAWGLARGKPFQVLVQVTNRCNMRCSFCDFWPNGARPEQELTLDDYRRVSRELAGLGRFLVSVEGGEPFVRPDIIDIIRAFGEWHLPTLFTNGWYVTEESARALWAAGTQQVGVSIDFPDAERHDGKRGPPGATERAWRAIEVLRDTAPHGSKQVHVMTVIMEANWRDVGRLLEQSAAKGVGHALTLLSTGGFRRGKEGPDRLPPPEAGRALEALWAKHPHVRFFRDYFARMETFLAGEPMPSCRAGQQSFNLDHLGNVAPCIETIDRPVGNVREASMSELHARLVARKDEVARCNACWTACRGFAQAMSGGGSVATWRDLTTRMRSR